MNIIIGSTRLKTTRESVWNELQLIFLDNILLFEYDTVYLKLKLL